MGPESVKRKRPRQIFNDRRYFIDLETRRVSDLIFSSFTILLQFFSLVFSALVILPRLTAVEAFLMSFTVWFHLNSPLFKIYIYWGYCIFHAVENFSNNSIIQFWFAEPASKITLFHFESVVEQAQGARDCSFVGCSNYHFAKKIHFFNY